MSSLLRRASASSARLLLGLCVAHFGSQAALAEALQTSAPQVMLVEAGSGSVLFEKSADDPVNPASTAKLMTAELVFSRLKAGTLRRDQLLTVSQTAWREGGASSGGSTMFAKPRSEISVQDLLRGLIIDSGNDAAITLAEGIAGSEGAFATLMTKRARELGLPNLTFTDAWGNANPKQKVTARDMARLANHIINDYPDDYKLFAEREFTWNKIKQPNRNPLLGMSIGADGLKTGNIGDGFSIVGSAVQDGKRLTLALYGAHKASERAEESRKILQWGFRNFESRKLFAQGETVGWASVYGGVDGSVPLVAAHDVDVFVARDAIGTLNASISYVGPLAAPVSAGTTLATLHVYRGKSEILQVPLATSKAVATGSLSQRALDAGMSYVGDLVRRYVLRT